MTWEEIVAAKEGTIFEDWFDESIRCLIMRGPASLCVYLGVPSSHPLAGFDYDSLPIDCHGGLTFAGEGSNGYRPEGWYWYGFDYGHAGDYAFYYDLRPLKGFDHSNETKWTVEKVKGDIWSAVSDFKVLAKLAERIARKPRGLQPADGEARADNVEL